VYYIIDTARIHMENGWMDFGRFTIKDTLGNKGYASGKLYQKGFKNMQYDFDVQSNRMLLVNTTAKDNSQFYGNATGKASFSLKGPETDMRMEITGEPTDSSYIYIPINQNSGESDAEFIVFKQYGTEQADKKNTAIKLSVGLDLKINNKAWINVILDELNGDVLKARGSGNLKIKVPADGEMTMRGRYNIDEGNYGFNFQSIIRKPFVLKKNAGSYIEWQGNPYEADLKVAAVYQADGVTMTDILSGSSRNTYRGKRESVDVVANISGKLSQPDIRFSIQLQPSSELRNDDGAVKFLASLEQNQNEMLKQVSTLLVFNSFVGIGDDGSGGNDLFGSLISGTISGLVSGAVNKWLDRALAKAGFKLELNYSVYNGATLYGNSAVSGSNAFSRNSANLKFIKNLMNDKILITVGGDFDYTFLGAAAAAQGNFMFLHDVTVEIVLSKDRKLRGILFSKSNIDAATGVLGQRSRHGASISYRRDFDSLKELFQGQARKPKPAAKAPAPSNTAGSGK
jgi:hypothetical protein